MKLDAVPYSLRDDIHITLRSANKEDAIGIINLLKELSADTHFSELNAEEIDDDVSRMQKYILDMQNDSNSILILVLHDFDIIGYSSIEPVANAKKLQHRGIIHGDILSHYLGYGIGRLSLQTILKLVKKMNYEQVEAEIFADNRRKVDMYEQMGFEQWTRVPRAYKLHGDYVDKLILGKLL